jgi:SAM-dependent methyltransferase
MPRRPLIACYLLDPRDAQSSASDPIPFAVNIPLAELPDCAHELPPRERVLHVVGDPASARRAVELLRTAGRNAMAASERAVESSGRGAGRVAGARADAMDRAQRRSLAHAYVGRLWEPSAYLAERTAELAPGAALDLACGTGRDAVYLASCGWRVVGVDALPDALQRAARLASRCAAAIEPVEWRCIDLEVESVDFSERFDLITGFRYLHRPLFGRFEEWLTPDGHVIYETFTTLHRARCGKPSSDAHVLHFGELATLLWGFEVLDQSEDWRDGQHTARIHARRRS